ncbi:MAG TPA: TlpA disulfide reductase family protein [Gemmataceae bacterium]|nr:TlpA disulfide reductase family protein [Gemmataceae bacterium]
MSPSCRHAVAGVLLVFLAGCSSPATPVVVSGVVTLDGEPLSGGRVTFLGPGNNVAANEIGSDGRYTLAAATPGPVRVVVTGPVVPSLPGRDRLVPELQPPDRGQHLARSEPLPRPKVPPRYADPDLTPLSYTIGHGQQTWDIALESDAPPKGIPRVPDGPPLGLEPGQVVPDVEGPDLDGQVFKLSDYRGRVVLVYFWGQWCSLCRDEHPHLRALVERHRGQPFALLGVNCDGDREVVRRAVRDQSLPWRSWWDGDLAGQVAQTWEVKGWPAFYLLDGRGVVRVKNLRGAELDQAVEDLLRPAADPPP